MRPHPIGAAFLVAAIAAATSCKKESPFERAQSELDEPPAADPVHLDVSVAKTDVALGDDVVFRFKLTNSGKSKVTVNVPRIDQRSVSFRVRRADGSIAMVTRNHADIDQRTGQFIYEAGDAKELGPGESLEQDVATVAVEKGKLAITPSYVRQGAPSALVAPTIDVTVTPADPGRARLGVKMETSEGPYSAVFRPDVAYDTVESFVALAKRGYFTGLKFHRIVRGFMAQGGDPKGDGSGGPGYFLPLEARPDKLPHTRGVMSMARTGIPHSAGSQFFLMFKTDTDLDKGRYTTFAEMVDGEETLKKLEDVPVGPNSQGEMSKPKREVLIKVAQIVVLP